MLLYLSLLPLYLSLLFAQADAFRLAQDMEKDLGILRSTQYFISDNASLSPSLQTVESDFQLFKVLANIELSNGTYNSSTQGNHQISRWDFNDGAIKTILQVETTLPLDTVIMQRYLDNRPPTQQRVKNTFRFRAYAVATAANPQKLVYLTEADQGLLAYRLEAREVEIIYGKQKEGLSAALPGYTNQVKLLMHSLLNQP